MKVKSLSHIRLFVTLWTAAYQASPPMGFSRQEYWSGLPLPSPKFSYMEPIKPFHTFPLTDAYIQRQEQLKTAKGRAPSLHGVLSGAFSYTRLKHKQAAQLSGRSHIIFCYVASQVTQYHFRCILLVTRVPQVHPDSRREELGYLFMGKCQSSRRVYGMEDSVTVQCYFSEDLLTSPVSPGILATIISDMLKIISLINTSLFQVHLQLLA